MNKITKLLLKIIGFEEIWTLGYRRAEDSLFLNSGTPFRAVKDLKKYWYADPIVYLHENKEYCFFEMYDRKLLKGGIGVAEVTENGLEQIRLIIEEEFHMSYPTVFKLENDVFMIPECSQTGGIRIYKCLKFPETWECVTCFEKRANYTDTNIVSVNGNAILLDSSVYHAENAFQTKNVWNKLNVDLEANTFDLIAVKEDAYSYLERNGGSIVKINNKRYVPKQISRKNDYGLGLNFYEYCIHDLRHEDAIKKTITADDFRTDLKKKVTGIHTYARGNLAEIIDIRILSFNPYKWIWRLKKLVNNKKMGKAKREL